MKPCTVAKWDQVEASKPYHNFAKYTNILNPVINLKKKNTFYPKQTTLTKLIRKCFKTVNATQPCVHIGTTCVTQTSVLGTEYV